MMWWRGCTLRHQIMMKGKGWRFVRKWVKSIIVLVRGIIFIFPVWTVSELFFTGIWWPFFLWLVVLLRRPRRRPWEFPRRSAWPTPPPETWRPRVFPWGSWSLTRSRFSFLTVFLKVSPAPTAIAFQAAAWLVGTLGSPVAFVSAVEANISV